MNPEIYSLFDNTAVNLVKQYRRRAGLNENDNELTQSDYLTTGIPELDKVITGFRPADVICFIGDSPVLTQCVVYDMLQHLCEEHGKVLLLSAGTPAITVIEKVIDNYQYKSSFSNIANYDAIKQHELIAKMPLFIEDAPYLNIDIFIAEIKSSHYKLKFIVIDDILVFLKPCHDLEVQESLLAEIISSLKQMAIDLGIVIIVSPIDETNNFPLNVDLEGLELISYSHIFKKADRILYVSRIDNDEEFFEGNNQERQARIISLKSYKIDKECCTDEFTVGQQIIKIEQTISYE